jgi:uncharacterized membrane protein HdeD (DUF308 family)
MPGWIFFARSQSEDRSSNLEEVGSYKMKNSAIFYAAIALGVIALVAGIIFLTSVHPFRGYVALAVGAILLIGGVVGMFMSRPKAVAK